MAVSEKSVSSSLTIADIARELGVSKTTISRVISGKGRISEETRVRVQTWIRKHNYTPNYIARGLANNKTYNAAIVIPKDADKGDVPFFQDCLIGISETIARRGYDAVLAIENGDDISTLERMVRHHKVDGVVLTRLVENDWAAEFLQNESVPFVALGTTNENAYCQVDSDQSAGCYEITMHVLKGGCRRVVLLGGDRRHLVNKRRYDGFEKAFAQYNKDSLDAGVSMRGRIKTELRTVELKPLDVVWDLYDAPAVNEALNNVLKEAPQCIVCMDDVICTRVLAYLKQKEYQIPEDIQIVSFYDSSILENNTPPITALSVNAFELSKTAGTVLTDMIEGKKVPQKNTVAYQIKFRESTC
jgi:DNA-binding LacI/PurR family transcriptional regulator